MSTTTTKTVKMEKGYIFNRKKIGEVLAVFLFYLFFALLYRVVLWVNAGQFETEGYWGWMDPERFWFGSGLQYIFLFIAALVIWFLGFYIFRKRSRQLQITVVFLLIPLFAYVTREIRYGVIDNFGIFRLQGNSVIWDWYIPVLFLYIQFGCFFAYRYFRENQKKLILESELRQAALKGELAAIKAQLNPHFLYNVFNTINASLPAENERTRNMIAQLSDLFRYQLMASKKEVVPLKEELDFVLNYLNLEKERFQDRLHIDVKVSGDLMDEKVPPMLLQPLVENSVKHGLASLIEGGTITMYIYREEGKLKFEISDTGVGIMDKSAVFDRGIGLTNTQLRLQKMYNSQLELWDNFPNGLTVKFAI